MIKKHPSEIVGNSQFVPDGKNVDRNTLAPFDLHAKQIPRLFANTRSKASGRLLTDSYQKSKTGLRQQNQKPPNEIFKLPL